MLVLPQTAVYALRAVYLIAEEPDGAPVRVGDIAAALKVPQNYLSKTLCQLARAGILHSTRGPHGGFQLVKSPDHLTLSEVVRPFLPHRGRACLLGSGTCNAQAPCATHHRWKRVTAEMTTFFTRTTIDTLLQTEVGARRPAEPGSRSAAVNHVVTHEEAEALLPGQSRRRPRAPMNRVHPRALAPD